MAYDVTPWTEEKVIRNGVEHKLFRCTSTATTSDYHHYTPPTPGNLDTSKPFLLIANAASKELDSTATAMPIDVYAGWGSTFALSGPTASSITVTAGAKIVDDAVADIRTAVATLSWNPNATAAHIPAPMLAFQATNGGVMVAASCVWIIYQ